MPRRTDRLAQLVRSGKLRDNFLCGQPGGPGPKHWDVANCVTNTCKVVQYNETSQTSAVGNSLSGSGIRLPLPDHEALGDPERGRRVRRRKDV